MATNKELLQEACDRVRLGKSLTNKMKVLLARAALEQVDEIEASVRVAAIDISEGMKNERRKKKLTKRREEKKVEARNMGVDKKLAGGLSAIALENAGKEKVMSLKALSIS